MSYLIDWTYLWNQSALTYSITSKRKKKHCLIINAPKMSMEEAIQQYIIIIIDKIPDSISKLEWVT